MKFLLISILDHSPIGLILPLSTVENKIHILFSVTSLHVWEDYYHRVIAIKISLFFRLNIPLNFLCRIQPPTLSSFSLFALFVDLRHPFCILMTELAYYYKCDLTYIHTYNHFPRSLHSTSIDVAQNHIGCFGSHIIWLTHV